jgi:hypothetical protein
MRVQQQQQQNSSHTPFWANAAAILRKKIGQESGALGVRSPQPGCCRAFSSSYFILFNLFIEFCDVAEEVVIFHP